MPYQFKFHARNNVGNSADFRCNLQCTQCSAITKEDTQCSRNTCIGTSMCWQHMMRELKLKIRPSDIPPRPSPNFKGLFAWDSKADDNAVIFQRGDRIPIIYVGELISKETASRRYGIFTAPYSMQKNKTTDYDSACLRGIAALINDNDRRRLNAEFYTYRGEVRLRAIKPIKNRQEIYASYGRDYIMNEEGVRFSTKYVK